MVGMQIIPGRQKTLRRLYLSQMMREGILQAGKTADGHGIVTGCGTPTAMIAELAVREAKPDDVLLGHAQALITFETLITPDLGDAVFLVKTAIAHAAIGDNQYMDGDLFPLGELNEKARSQNGIVIVGADYKVSLFFSLPVSRNIGKLRAGSSFVSDQAYKFEFLLHLSELTFRLES